MNKETSVLDELAVLKPRRGRLKSVPVQNAVLVGEGAAVKPRRGRKKKVLVENPVLARDGAAQKPRCGRKKIVSEADVQTVSRDIHAVHPGVNSDITDVNIDANTDVNTLKDMVMQALDNAGGVAYLTDQALNNPNAFFGLVKSVCTKSSSAPESAPKNETIVIRIRGLKTKP